MTGAVFVSPSALETLAEAIETKFSPYIYDASGLKEALVAILGWEPPAAKSDDDDDDGEGERSRDDDADDAADAAAAADDAWLGRVAASDVVKVLHTGPHTTASAW